MSDHRPGGRRRVLSLVAVLVLLGGGFVLTTAPPAAADQTIGFPVFTGPANPVPPEPAPYTVDGMFPAMFQAEQGGTDFWMDRLLARVGSDPAGNNRLMTRGRALYFRTHQPNTIGFGGSLAYYNEFFDRFQNQSGYVVTIGTGGFTESVPERRQTPSHWRSVHDNSTLGVRATVTKFITHDNVAVANVAITNTGTVSRTLPLTVTSPFATTAEGTELTGILDVMNSRRERLTTVFPRLSGSGLAPDSQGRLTGSVTLAPGATTTVKVQLGFVAEEIPESRPEYDQYRAMSPDQAFATHVRVYNQWWADNVPYFDVPDPAIKKFIYYRWWLMRFNYLDADIPGNDFQFPTSIEGVLGYNNAIALTVPMFIDDLKYLRDPVYSYGPWVSTGESSRNARFMDNPGDPENWSNSYTQYIAEAAWRSYQIHGGQRPIVENLARYAEGDVRGQLDFYDTDGNGLIEYSFGALTGNDADAVSFDWRPGNLDRAESAYQYSGALAAAQAYDLLGDTARAEQMRAVADRIADATLTYLWNPERQLFEHRHVATGANVPWKEINNYYPFSVGAIPNEAPYTNALRLFADENEYPIFPFYTANQRDKAEAAEQGFPGSNNFSQINSTVQFRLFSSVLRRYDSDAITVADYKRLLYWNAWAAYIGGNTSWPDSNEFWFNWNPATQTFGRSGIHHTILGSSNWTVVEDVMGLRPRNDDNVELWPIDIDWTHFSVNHLRYRDANLTIVWDDPTEPASHYPGVPQGYSVFVNGQRAFTVSNLAHLVWDPDTGTVTFPDSGDTAQVLFSTAMPGLRAPQEVAHSSARMVDVFAKAGADLTATGSATNLARGATATASFTAPGTSPAGAVDGFTINEPYWGTTGSPNAQDWLEVDLGSAQTFDDVKLYFYRDRTATGQNEPGLYQVQYHNGSTWVTVPGQVKTPTMPRANYNHVQFAPITAQRVRVLASHQGGHRTGLKELEVFRTGVTVPAPTNLRPAVLAREDPTFRQPGQARLLGTVKDDGLPSGQLTASWRLVSGPGRVIFDPANQATTVATFTQPGSYDLELTAGDGALTTTSRVTVQATAPSNVVNVALTANESASYTSPWETVAAVNDGIDPPVSNDTQNPRWGTWPNGGTQWVQYEWSQPVRVNASDMYFFADVPAGGNGGVQTPQSWSIQYWNGTQFVDVANPSGYGTAADRYNPTTFSPVTTTRMRASLVARPTAGGVGILEWKVYAEPPAAIERVWVPTEPAEPPDMPEVATMVFADGTEVESRVVWETVTPDQVAEPGTRLNVLGVVDGTRKFAEATVYVIDPGPR